MRIGILGVYVTAALSLMIRMALAEVIEQQAFPEYDVTFKLQGSGEVKVILADEGAANSGYVIKLGAAAVGISKRVRGVDTKLGTAGKLPATIKPGTTISIKRRTARITVLSNGLITARALDADFGGGSISYTTSGDAKVSEPRCQPIDPIYFAEDFTRTSEANPNWENVSGTWLLSYRPIPEYSANGFWYKGKNPEGVALAVAGYPFWDNYSVQAAVRPTEDSFAVGLCCYYLDQKNYLLFRWTSAIAASPDANARQLIRMQDGKRTVLKSAPGGFTPNEYQWYRLRLNVEDDLVQVLIDGVPVLSAQPGGLGQGKVGLYTERSGDSYFDDVLVRSWSAVREDFNGDRLWSWRDQGKWTIQHGGLNAKQGTGEAASFCGLTKWQDYTLSLSMLPSRNGSAGIYCNYQDDRNYYLLRNRATQCELVRVSEGRSQLVDKAAVGLPPDRWSDITVESRGSYLRINAGSVSLEDSASGPVGGKIGLYVGPGTTASFRRVRVYFLEKAEPSEHIVDRFSHDEWMRAWAAQESGWNKPDQQSPNLYWHKGDFYADTRVEFTISSPAHEGKGVQLALCADDNKVESGYSITIAPESGTRTVMVKLSRTGKQVAEGTAKFDSKAKELLCLVEKHGRFLIVSVDDLPVLRYRDPAPLLGTKLAFQSKEAAAQLARVVVSGDHHYQYTFNDAPVDWAVQGGVWGVQPRYACDPRWSFYGGWSQGLAAIWHKQPLVGDVTLEFYAAIKMDFPGEDYGQRFRDICASICADGKHLNSGYTVIYGGWQNTRTRLLRGNQIVAETDKYQIPGKDAGGHRKWFPVTLRKRSNEIFVYIDGEQALTYRDPQPLRGGHVAIWTRNNGIMVARTDVFYQRTQPLQQPVEAALPPAEVVETKSVLPLLISSPTHPSLGNDFEVDTGQWSRRRGELGASLSLDQTTASQGIASLRLTNTYPAGTFAATAVATSFDVSQLSQLSFDYRFPREAQVNLYLKAGSKDYCLLLTGEKIEASPVIGRVPITVDNQWHHAEVNLAELLSSAGAPLNLDEVAIADRRADEKGLTWYGFGTVPGGTEIHLDNFYLRSPGGRSAKFEWRPAIEGSPLEYSYVFDQKSDTIPPAKSLGPMTSATFTADAPGLWYIHVRASSSDGKWGSAFHYAALVK